MALVPDLYDRIERSFEDYPCFLATAFGTAGVAGVLTGQFAGAALLSPAVALYGAKCIGKQPTIPFPGYGRYIPGGQCQTDYQYRIRFKDRSSGGVSGEPVFNLVGPVVSVNTVIANNGFGQPRWFLQAVHGGGALNINNDLGLNPDVWEFDRESLIRLDGQPDNCGNAPAVPIPPVVPPNPYPPAPPGCPPGSICVPEFERPVPIPAPDGGKPIYLPIVIKPIIIPFSPTFPISVPIDLGGIKIGEINIEFNGTMNFNFSTPSTASSDYSQILAEIKACACATAPPPECPSEVKNVPYLDSANGACSLKTASITVVPGGLSVQTADRLQLTAEAALLNCLSEIPEQKPEVLLGTGTVPFPVTEQFVTGVAPEIVSVRVKITGFSEANCPAITTYPGAAQRKFGSVGFSLPPAAAGGDYVYIYDSDTYYPVPRHGKTGLIRLLLKSGTSWEVYDTGERL